MATRQQTLLLIMLVAIGFAVSSMTQFRIPGLPVGVAEVLLILCMVIHLPLGHGLHGGNKPNRFVPALFVLFLATLPGYFATLTASGQVEFALYNLIASAWVLVLFTYLHYGFDHRVVDLDRLGQLFLLFSSVYFGVLLALSVFDPNLVYAAEDVLDLRAQQQESGADEGPILRLIGFSTNPNQVALHALVCAFFAIHLYRRNGLMVTLICLGAACATGYLTGSDAFLFSLVALLGVAIVMGIVFNQSVILGLIILVPAIAAAVILFVPVVNQIQEIVSASDQDATRFALWRHGIEAGLQRPLIGLGPGAWSGFEGPLEFEEAHNSAVDYFSNAGLIGSAVLALCLAAFFLRALLSRRATLLAGAVAIVLFAMFHNVLRQPITWLALYFIVQAIWPGGTGASSARRGSRSRRRRGRRSTRPTGNLPV